MRKNSFFQRFLWAFLILVLIGISVAFFVKSRNSRSSGALPLYGEVPDFSLIEKTGRRVTKADLAGKIWIADFIFTRCQGQCPFMTQKMAEVRKSIPNNENLKWVSISVDPSWDTPEILSRYAEEQKVNEEGWLFLTGGKEEIFSLIRNGFHLGVEEEGGNVAEPIMHSNRFILIDQDSKIRGMYSAVDEEALKKLRKDVSALLKEK